MEPVSAWPVGGSIGRGFDNKFHFDAVGDEGRLRAPTIIIRMIITACPHDETRPAASQLKRVKGHIGVTVSEMDPTFWKVEIKLSRVRNLEISFGTNRFASWLKDREAGTL